jgi:hypothetical protein
LPLISTNIFLSTPFSNTLNLCSPLNVTDHVSHQHTTTCKLEFYVFKSLYLWVGKWKTKYSAQNDSKHSLSPICSYFLHECNFHLLLLFSSIWVWHKQSKRDMRFYT